MQTIHSDYSRVCYGSMYAINGVATKYVRNSLMCEVHACIETYLWWSVFIEYLLRMDDHL